MRAALAIGALVASGLAFVVAVDAKHGTTESKTYVGGTYLTYVNSCNSSEGIGAVRFCTIDAPAPATVAISISDWTNLRVGAQVVVQSASGATLLNDVLCGSGTFAIPAGASQLVVAPNGAGTLGGCVSFPGTTGRVTVTWNT